MENKIICRYCKSEKIVKRGLTKTNNRGNQQRYLCKDCKRTFIKDEGFYKMKNDPNLITMAVDMYLSNLSSRKMRNQLKRHGLGKVSHQTILTWVRKYVLMVNKFVDKLDYKLGNSFYADETVINRKGKNDRFWACVDWDTRMITGTHYSLEGNIKEAVTFLKKATAKGKPNFIKTDSAKFYSKAFRKTFSKMGCKNFSVEHKMNNVYKTKKHNYKIETVFMKIKDRVNDFRSLKALWSAPIILLGLVIQHNFIEEHTTTKRVPCELAGINLNLGNNRWLDLIRLSSSNNT